MRKNFLLPLIILLSACGHHQASEEHDHANEGHNHDAETAAAHGAEGEIVLHSEVAAQFGVEIDTVGRGDFSTALRASGMVITANSADAVVSAPTAGIVRIAPGIELGKDLSRGSVVATIDASGMSGGDANAAARAALEAAKTEY